MATNSSELISTQSLFDEGHGHILLVDDEQLVGESFRDFLELLGYKVILTLSGEDALEAMEKTEVDLVITDLNMPGVGGFEVLRRGRKLQPLCTFIVLSGEDSFQNAQQAVRDGAYDFVTKPVRDWDYFRLAVARGLEHRTLLTTQHNYQRQLEVQVAAQTKELAETNNLLRQYADQLELSSISSIASLMSALEEKDRYTAGHSRRVTLYTMGIAAVMGLDSHERWLCQTAAQMHDIGKIIIDLSYVRKPGPLNEEEWALMKQHPEIGERILAPLSFLSEVCPLIKHHHERLDGRGYPGGLSGAEINMYIQVLSVADSFDAMTSSRAYRRAIKQAEALEELYSCVGRAWSIEPVRALDSYLSRSPIR